MTTEAAEETEIPERGMRVESKKLSFLCPLCGSFLRNPSAFFRFFCGCFPGRFPERKDR